MDERHLVAAVRYVELNPVRAGLCCGAQEWEWSSARAHLNGEDDQLVRVDPMLEIVGVWQDYLDAAPEDSSSLLDSLREHGRSGRPLGGPAFVETVEKLTGRRLRRSVQPTAS
jgi:putative transposase